MLSYLLTKTYFAYLTHRLYDHNIYQYCHVYLFNHALTLRNLPKSCRSFLFFETFLYVEKAVQLSEKYSILSLYVLCCLTTMNLLQANHVSLPNMYKDMKTILLDGKSVVRSMNVNHTT